MCGLHPCCEGRQGHVGSASTAESPSPHQVGSPKLCTWAVESVKSQPVSRLTIVSHHFLPLCFILGSSSKNASVHSVNLSSVSIPTRRLSAHTEHAGSLSSYRLTLDCFSSLQGEQSHICGQDSWRKLYLLSPYDLLPLPQHTQLL